MVSDDPPETVKVEVVAAVSTSTETSVVPYGRSRVSPAVTLLPLIWKLEMSVLVFAAATATLKV